MGLCASRLHTRCYILIAISLADDDEGTYVVGPSCLVEHLALTVQSSIMTASSEHFIFCTATGPRPRQYHRNPCKGASGLQQREDDV
jgi:hypothetical protein